MPRPLRKKLKTWEVIRPKASPATFVGLVEAPDEQTALKLVIGKFKVRPADQWRLVARPC